MTANTNQPSRRDILKWFAGVPFLPLGAMGTAAALTGCNDDNDNNVVTPPAKLVKFKNAKFTPMAAPTTTAEMATTSVKSSLTVTWEDNTTTEYKLGYQEFFRTGMEVDNINGGKIIAGSYYDINNKAIKDTSVAGQERQFFSDCPDGSSMIHLKDAKVDGVNNPVFHVVQFEYTTQNLAKQSMYGQLPSPIAVLTLDQDQKTGHLALKKYFNVDMSKVHGLWITCGASLSPWNTHLSSEEYEPDAFDQIGSTLATLRAYSKNLYGNENTANAYNYGHLPEIILDGKGRGTAVKHYCLGRISHELIQVMPDNRTVIMGDDYTNGGFFMFIADKEKDLSAGTLYVAKYTAELNETSTAPIKWIKLGHTDSKTIEDLVNVRGIKADNIMESLTTAPADLSGYTQIVLDKKTLWIKLKEANNGFSKAEIELAAAFLETHRYAALKGGSMAFTKMEGTTVNIKDKVAYSALANIQDSMIEGKSSWVAAHNVKFKSTLKAGGVLAHDLKGSQVDHLNNVINSEWTPYQSHMILMGKDIPADSLGNTADPNNIASPDNLKFSETLRTLFIGEDSGNHTNNFLWAYNVETKSLDRILSTPAGAESTGLHAVDSVNGWTYIMSNFQHAGDSSSLPADLKAKVLANYNGGYSASVGYITADPVAPSIEKKA
ncbi:PhoX family protein [Acinetobacter gyllenbergii]|uniref:PhoX family protein n=1 Tax=Acinetobacter gyllenbergii TaxID=134534 RepID=UPI0008068436|nr:alkaline phosphatase PhoX [Acinetobacter gyllenbergii]OBY74434.1 alkaline phosphatase [Acinetobacter gyllenbergii]